MALVVAGHPHLVGPDVGEQHVVGAEDLAGVPQRLLGLDDALGVVLGVGGEVGEHRGPGRPGVAVVPVGRLGAAPPAPLVEHPERVGQVTHHLDVDGVALVDLGGQEVHVDDRLVAIGVPQARVVLDHVVAERDHEVGLLDGPYRMVAGLQADGEQAALVVHVHTALGHERADHPDAGALDELAELGGGPTTNGPVAGEDDRAFGGLDGGPRLVDDLVVGDGPTEPVGLDGLGVHVVLGDVLGQFDQAGPGLLGLGDAHGLAHDLGEVAGVTHRVGPLGDGLVHGHHVHHLVGLLVEPGRGALPGQHDHGGAVHVGVGHAGEQVGGAGPEGAQGAGGLAGEAAVDLGHEGRPLLVAAEHEVDVGVLQGHHHVGVLLAGDAEDVADSLGLEAADEQIGRLHRGPPQADHGRRSTPGGTLGQTAVVIARSAESSPAGESPRLWFWQGRRP